MKKLLAISLTLVMVVSLSLTAVASLGLFVSSPSGNLAPQLVDYSVLSEDCTAKLVITSYADRASLREADLKAIEEAYSHISKAVKNDSLDSAIASLAKKNNLPASHLAVSDLFDISAHGCDIEAHEHHDGFKITLKADTLGNLVGLLRYNGTSWDVIEISEYNSENGTITFTVDELSPFAFVVNSKTAPNTGDNYMVYVWVALLVVSGLAFVLTVMPKKKKA